MLNSSNVDVSFFIEVSDALSENIYDYWNLSPPRNRRAKRASRPARQATVMSRDWRRPKTRPSLILRLRWTRSALRQPSSSILPRMPQAVLPLLRPNHRRRRRRPLLAPRLKLRKRRRGVRRMWRRLQVSHFPFFRFLQMRASWPLAVALVGKLCCMWGECVDHQIDLRQQMLTSCFQIFCSDVRKYRFLFVPLVLTLRFTHITKNWKVEGIAALLLYHVSYERTFLVLCTSVIWVVITIKIEMCILLSFLSFMWCLFFPHLNELHVWDTTMLVVYNV